MNLTDHVARLQAAELHAFRALAGRIPVRIMIDVGAHHGSTLWPFLEAGWRVWAFEPLEANRERLLTRAAGCDRLTVRPEAVSRSSGTAQLQLALNLDGSVHEYYHSLERTRADRYHRKGRSVEVPVVSLDDLVARGELPPEIGFLKIDTEGHDLAVLEGASRLQCAAVGVEFWCDRHPLGRSPSPAPAVIALMASRGYDAYLVLCHQAGETYVLGSNLDGVRPDAWGNLLFFHRVQQGLYAELLRELGRPIPAAPGLPGCRDAAGGEALADETEALLEEARRLQQACDERGEVIEGLERVAAERLALVEAIDREARHLRALIDELLAVAEERLSLMRTLDRDLRQVQAVAEERERYIFALRGELDNAHALRGSLEQDLQRAQGTAEERLAALGSLQAEVEQARALAARRLAVIQEQDATIRGLVAAEQARFLPTLRRTLRRAVPGKLRAFARRLLRRLRPRRD
jgi:FkbM family methyltransferase